MRMRRALEKRGMGRNERRRNEARPLGGGEERARAGIIGVAEFKVAL